MRKVILSTIAGTALLAGAALPVSAADLGVRSASTAAPAYTALSAFSWTGAYIGANVGGISGEHRFDPITATQTAGSASGCSGGLLGSCGFSANTGRDSSLIGGIQSGYRWQTGAWVLGVEQDFQWTDVHNQLALDANAPLATGPFLAGDAFDAKLKWLSSTRAQLGMAFDRWLVYAAGGLATGVMDVTGTYGARAGGSPAFSVSDESKWHIGWTVGAGVEYAITDSISLGAEYRYTELNSRTYDLGGYTFGNGRTFLTSADVGFRSQEVLARLNLKTSALMAMFGIR
jgi:opacity protein-like surface antigen